MKIHQKCPNIGSFDTAKILSWASWKHSESQKKAFFYRKDTRGGMVKYTLCISLPEAGFEEKLLTID